MRRSAATVSAAAAACLAAAGALWASASAGSRSDAADAPPGFTLTEVKPGVFAAIARDGDAETVGNAGFVVGTDAVLVVDAFATPRAAEALLAQIREHTKLPVRWLIDTHHHLDHCGGNIVFARAGCTIVSHEQARLRMQERGDRSALPSETYSDAITIWLGERRVDVFSRPGHTAGDSLISVPDADVLFGGDLLQNRTVPNLSDARTELWVKTLDEITARFPKAVLIPGHGPVARPLDMRVLRDYLVGLRLAVARELQEGKRGEEIVRDVAPRLLQQYRAWSGTEHIGETVKQVEGELMGRSKVAASPTPAP